MMRIFLLLIFLLTACVPPHGTGTGNPMSSSSPQGALTTVFVTVCRMIERCHAEVSDQSCYLGIRGLTTYAPKFGLNRTPAPTIDDILNLESTGEITEDA